MAMSGGLFITGALPSVVPYLCTSDVKIGTIVAGVLCCIMLFAVGAIKVQLYQHGFCLPWYFYFVWMGGKLVPTMPSPLILIRDGVCCSPLV
jgi:hypothetical protein